MKTKKWLALVLSVVCMLGMLFTSACGLFGGSKGLAYKVNEDGKTCTITGMGECTDTHLVIPKEIDGYLVTEIARETNFGETVTDITILPDTITVYNSSFVGTACYKDESNWENDVLYIGQYLIDTKETVDKNYTIKDGTKTIAGYAFAGRDNLESVTIPKTLKKVCGLAFAYEPYLFEHRLPVSNFSVYIEDLAAWCQIEFEDYGANPLNRYYVEDMMTFLENHENAHNYFYVNNTLVTELVIPDGVTEVKDYAFVGCQSITSATLPGSVTSLGKYAFSQCYSLKTLTLPASLEAVGGSMYDYIHCVEKVDFQGSIKDWCKIDFTFVDYVEAMRNGCTLLLGADLYIQGNLLENLVIPNTVATLKDCAFMGCKSIVSVTIPKSITIIERNVFAGCENLTTITFNGTLAEWDAVQKGEGWASKTAATKVVCTDGEAALS